MYENSNVTGCSAMYVRMYVRSTADKATCQPIKVKVAETPCALLVHTYVHEPAEETITDHPWKASTD